MNRIQLTVIGYLGQKTVYINVPKNVAIERYNADNPTWTYPGEYLSLKEFEVNDTFEVYDIWESSLSEQEINSIGEADADDLELEDLDLCTQCEKFGWDGHICHYCGATEN